MALDNFLNKEVNISKWNKMWDLWVKEEAESPYAEIMTYHSEVNSGGHYGFFDICDFRSSSDLRIKTVEILKNALPDVLSECVSNGYEAYLALEEGTDNESLIEDILAKYAETIEL